MVFVPKKQLLLKLLPLRVIVNGKYIHSLKGTRPIVIDMPTNPTRFVVSDGFHITQPFDLNYGQKSTSFLHISCKIEDGQILAGLALVILLYAMGATSGYTFLQALSLMPIGYFLYLYYGRRNKFIRVLKG